MSERLDFFSNRSGNRYWWHRMIGSATYTPAAYSVLSDEEWRLFEEWYIATDKDFGSGTGECSLPLISLLQALIMGNNIRRIVQLGHYVGYSTLLIGCYLRRMGAKNSLFSCDIAEAATTFTQGWVDNFRLNDYVSLALLDSGERATATADSAYLGGQPTLVFIDSSHRYQHTLTELDLWYEQIAPGGFLILHDVSVFAASFTKPPDGGVFRAVTEWSAKNNRTIMVLNGFATGAPRETPFPYLDGCGVGLIQKPA